MKSLWCSLGFFAFTIFLTFLFNRYEAFIGNPNAARCGVDQPPCGFGEACINGFCVDNTPPPLPKDTGLPVLP